MHCLTNSLSDPPHRQSPRHSKPFPSCGIPKVKTCRCLHVFPSPSVNPPALLECLTAGNKWERLVSRNNLGSWETVKFSPCWISEQLICPQVALVLRMLSSRSYDREAAVLKVVVVPNQCISTFCVPFSFMTSASVPRKMFVLQISAQWHMLKGLASLYFIRRIWVWQWFITE